MNRPDTKAKPQSGVDRDVEKLEICPKCRGRVRRDWASQEPLYKCKCGNTTYKQMTLF